MFIVVMSSTIQLSDFRAPSVGIAAHKEIK